MTSCKEIKLLHDFPHKISTKLWFCHPSHNKAANITWRWHTDTIITLFKFSVLHIGEAEVSILLGYDTMSLVAGSWHFEKMQWSQSVGKQWPSDMASYPEEWIPQRLYHLTLLQDLYSEHSLYMCLQLAMSFAWSRTVNK
jgi:hypothetical protein